MTLFFANIIIPVEVFSAVICAVLLYGTLCENRKKSNRRTSFAVIVAAALLGNAVDAYSWATESNPDMVVASSTASALSCLVVFVLYGLFMQYLYIYLSERHEIAKGPFYVVLGCCVGALIFTLLAGAFGQLYVISNGAYTEGPLYSAYLIASLICLILALITITLHVKTLGLHDALACYLYILIPGVCGMVNVFIEDFSLVFPAATISMLIIYVMVQSERAALLERENHLIHHHATHDELTDVQNRRAYVVRFDQLKTTETPVGVIFSDVNGLKYTNDTLGHAAGDELLKGYVSMLCTLFPKEDVYRISGDEFVVLLENLEESAFHQRAGQLQALLNEEEPQKACIGMAYGPGREVNEHVQWAEYRMYEQKQAFHAQHAEMNR